MKKIFAAVDITVTASSAFASDSCSPADLQKKVHGAQHSTASASSQRPAKDAATDGKDVNPGHCRTNLW